MKTKKLKSYIEDLQKDKLNAELVPLFEYAVKHQTPIISEEGRQFLLQMLHISNAKRVLEIGTAIAYNALSITLNTTCEVVTIERDPKMIEQAKKNIDSFNMTERITLVEGDALEVDLDTLGQFDVIFIDAAKAQYVNFFERYESLLNSKGLIIADNLLFHGLIVEDVDSRNLRQLLRKINNFNQYVVKNPNYQTSFYQLGDGMSVSIKKV